MAPYNYSNYYDPVGSANNSQPSGYTYQSNNTTQYPSQSNYPANYNQNYNTNYGNQQYGTNAQQQQPASSTTNRAASTMNSLPNNPSYSQAGTGSRSNNAASSYDTNTYYASAGFAAMNDRNQSNNSPLYATNTAASTFGRLSLPDQSQSSSNTFGNTQTYPTSSSNASTQYQNAPSQASSRHHSYKTAYTQAQNQTQPPQRYASPLHAVQAQQHHGGHAKQSSRSSNPQPSPQMNVRNVQQQESQYQRQASGSVEPSPTTVDPTQVYDIRAEQQRKAQADAEKRRQREAERAARKAEEDARKAEEESRVAEEATRKAEAERQEKDKREAEDKAKKAEEEAAKKKAAADRKNEQRRKAREEKRQSKTAATALTQMASSSAADAAIAGMPGVGDMSGPPANDEEAEMRAMFKKMREFNARNPAMLAKLWEEERQTHATQASSSPPQQPPAKPAAAPAPKKQQQKAGQTAANQRAQQTQPFKPVNAPAAASSSQASPAVPSATPTQQGSAALWPPHKKGSLAEAAARWLNNLPQNKSVSRYILKQDVLKILDSNPSYVQLCENIEKTGIQFERSALAKELLKAVPDGLRNQAKPGAPPMPTNGIAAQVTGAAAAGDTPKRKPGRPKKDGFPSYSVTQNKQSGGPVNYQAPVFSSLADAAREINSMSTASTFPPNAPSTLASAIASAPGQTGVPSPYFDDQPMVDAGDDSQPIEVKDEEKPEEPPKPPANKEEAARKRTFNDLVDLTKGDDSDDEGPPRKMQQPFGGPANGAVKHQQQQSNGFSRPVSFQQFMQQRNGLNPGQGAMHPSAPRPPWGTFSNSQQKPPTPVLPSQPKPKGPTEEAKQYERMRGKMLVEPIMRDRVARKSKYDSRTVARDVLLATGRHPDMRPLNAHLNTMQKLLGDHGGVVDGAGNKSDLATIRWDIIDPGEAAEEAKAKAKSALERPDNIASEDVEDEADDEGDVGSSQAADVMRRIREGEDITEADIVHIDDAKLRAQIKNRLSMRKYREKQRLKRTEGEDSEGGKYVSVQDQIRGGGANPIKRRGRPPKSGAPAAPDDSARSSPAINNTNTDILGSDLTPRKTAKPAKPRASDASPSMATGTPVGYAQFRQYDENGNIIKKKGRPVGWRKSVHSREAQGLTPAKSASGQKAPASGSRLRQSTGPTAKENSVQPQYQVYKCRWSDCGAELDNLERLKKHVVKIHGNKTADDNFECQWQPCRFQGKHMDADGKATEGDEEVTSFETIEHWMKHVTKEHLEDVAWKLGDGPRGGSVSEQFTDSEAYLSDAQGRSVTPIIVPMSELKTDGGEPILQSDLSPERPRVGRPPKNPPAPGMGGMTKEQREAKAELKKLEDQKRAEGITMGREGCRLANEKRRRGFLDDEDFEDVTNDSDA